MVFSCRKSYAVSHIALPLQYGLLVEGSQMVSQFKVQVNEYLVYNASVSRVDAKEMQNTN